MKEKDLKTRFNVNLAFLAADLIGLIVRGSVLASIVFLNKIL